MKRLIQFAFASLMASTCLTAHAAHLTQQDCHSYPFVHNTSSVTHDQLIHELELLRQRGYHPHSGDSANYPDDIEAAQDQLHRDYQRDCLHQNAPSM
jgi:hypothetical protein